MNAGNKNKEIIVERRNFIKSTAIMTGGLLISKNLLNAAEENITRGKPIIVIHGGAGKIKLNDKQWEIKKSVLAESLKAGQAILSEGGAAIDAVIAAIKVLEDSPEFNAGRGAVLTSNGFHELDASIMDGRNRKAGAVTLVRSIKNPIEAARLVMDKTWHTLLAAEGAEKLAKENGLEIVDQKYFFTQLAADRLKEAQEKNKLMLDHDKLSMSNYVSPYLGTVGAVAFDSNGNIAAGTSTGGMTNKMTGRIGDSPIVGSGNYADNSSVGLSCTGTGDIFMRVSAAHEVAALYKYKNLSLQEALDEALAQVSELNGEGGMVAIDKYGNPSFAITKGEGMGMYHGMARVGEEVKVFPIYDNN